MTKYTRVLTQFLTLSRLFCCHSFPFSTLLLAVSCLSLWLCCCVCNALSLFWVGRTPNQQAFYALIYLSSKCAVGLLRHIKFCLAFLELSERRCCCSFLDPKTPLFPPILSEYTEMTVRTIYRIMGRWAIAIHCTRRVKMQLLLIRFVWEFVFVNRSLSNSA